MAASQGHLGAVQTLLEADASSDGGLKLAVNGQSAIHAAAGGGHIGVLKALTSSCTSLRCDSTDCNGNTPLHLACGGAHKECIELLIILGANSIDMLNDDSKSPTELLQGDASLLALFP